MKRALITGVTGQDGSYLAEYLLEKGYHVRGIDCRNPIGPDWNAPADKPGLSFACGDITNPDFIFQAIETFRPDELYNLASQTRPDISAQMAEVTYSANLLAVVHILGSIQRIQYPIRFFQASSSEIFGDAVEAPQTESTPAHPRNPYGISKAAAHWHTAYCREAHGLFACNGILYNHESTRRGENFVTRKITLSAAKIKLGQQAELTLGNLDAKRDWGYAPDYVRAMHLMLQADQPADYIIASGQLHSVRDLLEIAFGHVGLDWRQYVRVEDQLVRAENGQPLIGDSSKARKILNWQPCVSFEEMVQAMVEADLEFAAKDASTAHS